MMPIVGFFLHLNCQNDIVAILLFVLTIMVFLYLRERYRLRTEKRRSTILAHSVHDVAQQRDSNEAQRLSTLMTMAGGFAHEFNNQLTPIQGYIELTIDELGPDHPCTEGLEIALGSAQTCTDLVAQIQAYGRSSLLAPEPVHLDRFLPHVVRISISSLGAQGEKIKLIEHYPEKLPVLYVDPGQLQDAIMHLLQNAVEAMPDGGTLTLSVETTDLPAEAPFPSTGTYACLRITDNGSGIAPDVLTHIFEPFFTTHHRAEKRGMGLPFVQGMAAQHGGWVQLASEPGNGTDVKLFLPTYKQAPEPEQPMDMDGTMAVLPAAPLGHLLVGDGDQLIRRLVRRMFTAEGWNVDVADSFDEVIRKTMQAERPYDLLILDMAMPGPSVEATLDLIQPTHKNVSIVLMGTDNRDERIDAMLAKVKGTFVSKPFSPKDLLASVDEIMA